MHRRERAKNWISVAFGLNMTGSEKLPPMAIAKPTVLQRPSAAIQGFSQTQQKGMDDRDDGSTVRVIRAPATPPLYCQEKERTVSTRQCVGVCQCG